MYPYHWTWTYTALTVLLLLVPFAVVGAVLLARHFLSPHGRARRSQPPEVIPLQSPYGDIPVWNVDTYKLATRGMERARARDTYYSKGRV